MGRRRACARSQDQVRDHAVRGGARAVALELRVERVFTVTCSPKHGVDRTVEETELLSARGHTTVLHSAASAVSDRRHLTEIVARLGAACVDAAFVIGGDDRTGSGAYPSAQRLLADLRRQGTASRGARQATGDRRRSRL